MQYKKLLVLLSCVLSSWALADVSPPPEAASGRVEKSAAIVAEKAMIVTAHPLASEVGKTILQQGGSAVDAVIAAQWVLGLVEPQSSGIGGGGFLLSHHLREGLTAWDGRETAPASA
ncbi:MAG: gamma-glutamyltransferase, partial [Aquaspirillum sp.]